MKYLGETSLKKLISLIKGDIAAKQNKITEVGILKGRGDGTANKGQRGQRDSQKGNQGKSRTARRVHPAEEPPLAVPQHQGSVYLLTQGQGKNQHSLCQRGGIRAHHERFRPIKTKLIR